ncbi:hypothetical protein CO659_29710 [Rhizobium sp. S9]|nr:hypothetical protein CO659_29710 [Rhizobium sp. S9]
MRRSPIPASSGGTSCSSGRSRHADLPLTLTLSPLVGRGDEANGASGLRTPVRHIPFAPFTGRRWRQPDEGLVSVISCRDISRLH